MRMTNRDWLNSLSDLKFASWIRNEFSLTDDEYLDLIDWLKQEHPEWHREERREINDCKRMRNY